jgi:hypothetical protein
VVVEAVVLDLLEEVELVDIEQIFQEEQNYFSHLDLTQFKWDQEELVQLLLLK